MKKILIIVLCLVFVIVLSGCAKKNTANQINTNTNTNQNIDNINDISSHNKPSDCWTIINGATYNISDYVMSNSHPGGSNIKSICGKDGSDAFNAIQKHSKIGDLLNKYKVQ